MTSGDRQLPFVEPPDDGLSDLDLIGAERRIRELDGNADFEAPRAPGCVCLGGGQPFQNEFGERVCWACGKRSAA